MFEIPYPNTRYAADLDYEQQLDYEEELAGEHVSIEEQEEKAFAERCRRSKVSATKLKKYEVELRKTKSKASKEISDLEWQAMATKSIRKARELRANQSAIRKQLKIDEQTLYDKYFKAKKR